MNENKRIIRSLIVVSGLFLVMVSYLLYFNHFEAPRVRAENSKTNEWNESRFLKRGNIYDRKNRILAVSEKTTDGAVRSYPYGDLFSQVVGVYNRTGSSFLEKSYNEELLSKNDNSVFNAENQGENLHLTIDAEFQKYVYEQLADREGAVVAMDPATGEILAMVSSPGYDPYAVAELTEKDSTQRFFSSNAVHEPDFPGSVFKIITAVAAIENGLEDEVINDEGSFLKGGLKINNYREKVYGEIGIERAFRESCNSYFCNIAYEVGTEKMHELYRRFGVDEEVNFDFPTEKSTVFASTQDGIEPYSERVHIAHTAIGQVYAKVTPLHMTMICATIANEGIMMQPYVVSNGRIGSLDIEKRGRYIISEACAEKVADLMVGVVNHKGGTGYAGARSTKWEIAGKTGTAETGEGADHAWFVGFAPSKNPRIAVTVFLEHDGGGGGTSAGPVAKAVIEEYLEKYNGK